MPGSRTLWHIDAGEDTQIVNVERWQSRVPTKSVDIGGMNVPRAWIEIEGEPQIDLHILNGVAVWNLAAVAAVSDFAADIATGRCAYPAQTS